MAHDANTVLMGATRSSIREVSSHKGIIGAGIVTRLNAGNTLVTTKAHGSLLGVSIGKDQSDTDFTAIARKGLRVPIRLAEGFTNPAIGAPVAVSDTTGLAMAYTGSGDGYVNAVYVTSKIDAIGEDGLPVADGVALIDFPGGL